MHQIPAHIAHLSNDSKLKPALEKEITRTIEHKEDVFFHLCASIMSQQLSTKVADVIKNRFIAIYGGYPKPQQVVDTAFDVLRAIGLSNAKVNYVQNVARYFEEHQLNDATFKPLSNEEVMDLLLPIKGVGKWTVEMLLMFTLGREDVFAVDDLGIQQGMIKLYGLETLDKKQLRNEMLSISASWSPYRTWACFYLWNYKDSK